MISYMRISWIDAKHCSEREPLARSLIVLPAWQFSIIIIAMMYNTKTSISETTMETMNDTPIS